MMSASEVGAPASPAERMTPAAPVPSPFARSTAAWSTADGVPPPADGLVVSLPIRFASISPK